MMNKESNLLPVSSCEVGRPVRKSIEMIDHGRSAIGSGLASPRRPVGVDLLI